MKKIVALMLSLCLMLGCAALADNEITWDQVSPMLEAAGVSVRFVRYPESRHGFTVRMNGAWQEAQQAIIDAINEAAPIG